MRASDLALDELLVASPEGGLLHLADQRVLIVDAVALGLLRQELIGAFGEAVARGVLTRFGYAHGWRAAKHLQGVVRWETEREWRIAGARLHMLGGACRVEVPAPTAETAAAYGEAIWHDSYEAEQHRLLIGKATEPVCWTLCGYASGYASAVLGREVYFLEDRCAGCGDDACHVVGRFKEDWGPAVEPYLRYYRRPCLNAELERVTDAIKKAERRLGDVRRKLAAAEEPDEEGGLVARSPGMRKVVDLARRVAATDTTVLVTGESGVGKERVARLIHEASPRAPKPFVAVNCGALPEPLLESELFGHARGSFTGAVADRPGLFEAAGGGTIFLDEIGEISPAMQVKLLRALQERHVRRVGENRDRAIDARVVAATNRDLAADVAAGRFRQDLFYRLRVIELAVPPLRARREEVLPIARAVLVRIAARLAREVSGFSPAAADALVRYDWPGNVRELENAVERAVVLCDGGRVDLDDLPEEIRRPGLAPTPSVGVRPLHDIEKDYILAVLAQNQGHQAKTAAQLGIGTATLYRKLKAWNVEAR